MTPRLETSAGSRVDLAVCAVLFALALFQVLWQSLVWSGLGADDAQLLLWAQAPRFGAIDQPTLLANLAWAADRIGVPPDRFIIIARQAMLAGTAILLRRAFGRWTENRVAAWLPALAFTLLPDAHRNGLTGLTHTPFMIFVVALCAHAAIRCHARPSLPRYLWLGCAMGLLPHAKYNAAAFALTLALTAVVDPAARRLVADRRMAGAAALALLLTAPPAIWALLNAGEIARAAGPKLESGFGVAAGLRAVLDAVADSLKYVIVFGVGCFAALRLGRREPAPDAAFAAEAARVLGRFCLVFLALALVAAGLAEIGEVKRRWLVPGALPAAALGGVLAARALDARGRRWALAALLAFWGFNNVDKAVSDLRLGEDRPKEIHVDRSAMAAALARRLAPGDVLVGPRIAVADLARRLDGVTGWAGETAQPIPHGRAFFLWREGEAPEPRLLAAYGAAAPAEPLRFVVETPGYPGGAETWLVGAAR